METNDSLLIGKHAGKILTTLDQHEFIAIRDTKCKRKGVAATILALAEDKRGELFKLAVVINGPVNPEKRECLNIKGGCGCMHSEQKAILWLAVNNFLRKDDRFLILSTYSPCTNCANIIFVSGFKGVVVYKYLTEHDTVGKDVLNENDIPCIPYEDIRVISDGDAPEETPS